MDIEKLEEMLPESLYNHALQISRKYKDNPEYVVHYLEEFLAKSEYRDKDDDFFILKIKLLISRLQLFMCCQEQRIPAVFSDEEAELKQSISEYYLRWQLVDFILDSGAIPSDPRENWVGVGFIDIADYSYLSKWLSPKENQVVLNGLYSALKIVLDKRGGYLNKMEGDSLMFQYGGVIDPLVRGKSSGEEKSYISRELFYSCVEMQQVCSLFNNADEAFLQGARDEETKKTLFEAFKIISNLRENLMFASAINSLFQIRIRIGANIGEVSIGNFGPHGAKQWDVIGVPVIEAKRMESTAPIGGLRISERLYEQLDLDGITTDYLHSFREAAKKNGGYFKDITKEEMFRFAEVKLKDKKNIVFKTYSIQVDPELPEALRGQVETLLRMGQDGSERIIEILQYYRGNRQVVNAVEDLFNDLGIRVRKEILIRCMSSRLYGDILERHKGNEKQAVHFINKTYSLYSIFRLLGRYQDQLKKDRQVRPRVPRFDDFNQFFTEQKEEIRRAFSVTVRYSVRRNHFYNKIFPLIFQCLKASLLEYQSRVETDGDLLVQEGETL